MQEVHGEREHLSPEICLQGLTMFSYFSLSRSSSTMRQSSPSMVSSNIT